eukprot:364003-Chlamydomonas_euryale.AAC.25
MHGVESRPGQRRRRPLRLRRILALRTSLRTRSRSGPPGSWLRKEANMRYCRSPLPLIPSAPLPPITQHVHCNTSASLWSRRTPKMHVL